VLKNKNTTILITFIKYGVSIFDMIKAILFDAKKSSDFLHPENLSDFQALLILRYS